MGALTPEFLMDLETEMRVVAEEDYSRLLDELWWQHVMKVMPSGSKRERVNWLLDTAKIERTLAGGGEVSFEDILSRTTEYVNMNAAAGLELKREELDDHDGGGVQLAAHWARQVGAYAAYWPQKMLAVAMRANGNTYDGLPFFSAIGAPHLVNPFKASAGSFANDFTGAAAGTYPGALPIDDSVTIDAAVNNLSRAIAYISEIKMPNGEDPRNLRVDKIIVPPGLVTRASQLTQAQYIAQAAAAGGGSGDISSIIRRWGFGEPIMAPEMAGAFGGSDTTYYILAKQITSSPLGAYVYVDREAFQLIMHGELTSAELARKRSLQWTTEGRNVVGNGHPYLLFRVQGT